MSRVVDGALLVLCVVAIAPTAVTQPMKARGDGAWDPLSPEESAQWVLERAVALRDALRRAL